MDNLALLCCAPCAQLRGPPQRGTRPSAPAAFLGCFSGGCFQPLKPRAKNKALGSRCTWPCCAGSAAVARVCSHWLGISPLPAPHAVLALACAALVTHRPGLCRTHQSSPWPVQRNEYIRYFRGHSAPVTTLATSPKTDLFMSTSQVTPVSTLKLENPTSQVRHHCFSFYPKS